MVGQLLHLMFSFQLFSVPECLHWLYHEGNEKRNHFI
uniref:Uncharacterized protein n=1 Tax=Anguilla anguilla TaxID=7936 RepID=A0A0E9QVJ4_ANGAN